MNTTKIIEIGLDPKIVDENYQAWPMANDTFKSNKEKYRKFIEYLFDKEVLSEDKFHQLAINLESDDMTTTLFQEIPVPNPNTPKNTLKELSGKLKKDESDYTLIEVIGQGAMGEVHLARHKKLKRKVAYKLLKNVDTQSDGIISRFLTEAQITAQLDHPNVIPLYDLEILPNQMGLGLKYIQGKHLGDYIIEAKKYFRGESNTPIPEKFSLATRLEHFLKICDALEAAHEKGILHRDLKPGNIMIGHHHEVYVMDWGIARVMGKLQMDLDYSIHDTLHLSKTPRTEHTGVNNSSGPETKGTDRTHTGAILGTPRYLSPEQAMGQHQNLDQRSDIYSLGLILQEIVTLKRATPNAPEKSVALMDNAQKGCREPVVGISPRCVVPKEIKSIIDKACAVDINERYPRVDELGKDIRNYINGKSVMAYQESMLDRIKRSIKLHPLYYLIFACICFIGLLSCAVFVMHESQKKMERLQYIENGIQGQIVAYWAQLSQIDYTLSQIVQSIKLDKNIHISYEKYIYDTLNAEQQSYKEKWNQYSPYFLKKSGIGPAFLIDETNTWVLPYTVDDDQKTIVLINASSLLLENLYVPEHQLYITDNNGTILMSQSSSQTAKYQNKLLPTIVNHIREGRMGHIVFTIENKEMGFIYLPLKTINAYMVIMAPMDIMAYRGHVNNWFSSGEIVSDNNFWIQGPHDVLNIVFGKIMPILAKLKKPDSTISFLDNSRIRPMIKIPKDSFMALCQLAKVLDEKYKTHILLRNSKYIQASMDNITPSVVLGLANGIYEELLKTYPELANETIQKSDALRFTIWKKSFSGPVLPGDVEYVVKKLIELVSI